MPDNNQENTPEVIPRLQYERVNWEDAPSRVTPLSADNLNTMDGALEALYEDVGTIWDKVKDIDPEAISSAVESVANKAGLDSPSFTGTPTAPTPDAGDSSENIATTAFVENRCRPLWIDMGTISSLPVRKDVVAISSDMVCTDSIIGNYQAKKKDWVVTTEDGYVAVSGASGAISGSTTLKLKLEVVTDA